MRRTLQLRVAGHLMADGPPGSTDCASPMRATAPPSSVGLVVPDQAALHGLLQKVRESGLPLVSVLRVGPTYPMLHQRASTTPTNVRNGD